MEREKAKAVLEAVLFTMGDSVEIGRLASVIEEGNKRAAYGVKRILSGRRQRNRFD